MASQPRTIPAALASALRSDPSGPLLTYYDERTGERVELSATTLDNWVCKTANLLVGGCALDSDDTTAVLLPAHWQTAAVLLGCLAAGAPVATAPAADAEPVLVAFAAADRLDQARALDPDQTYLLGLLPMAASVTDLPDDAADYIAEVRIQPDGFTAIQPVTDDDPALLGDRAQTHAELTDRASRHAAELGLVAGGRLLVPVDDDPDPLTWLFAPLLAGASVVLCRHASPDRLAAIATTERVTARA